MENIAYYPSPLGIIKLADSGESLTYIGFTEQSLMPESEPSPLAQRCIAQLNEYFAGHRKEFDLPLALSGTDFQTQAWRALASIPYGHTISYGEQAQQLGRPKAVRAIGSANSKNKLSIVLPCHRVVGKNGKLVGYAGGLWRKQWLLDWEKKN
ncbi:MAG: methylated-DNA--[protein]-cysteine S-methyltransferase [Prevotellaceae bacterium]|nr:methylated-DNA--[protein]-cysteine S-methyltransferase [Prevotellaceae bacterium]